MSTNNPQTDMDIIYANELIYTAGDTNFIAIYIVDSSLARKNIMVEVANK
jgi:hypothetical protein